MMVTLEWVVVLFSHWLDLKSAQLSSELQVAATLQCVLLHPTVDTHTAWYMYMVVVLILISGVVFSMLPWT